jgi:hypothetical protein
VKLIGYVMATVLVALVYVANVLVQAGMVSLIWYADPIHWVREPPPPPPPPAPVIDHSLDLASRFPGK